MNIMFQLIAITASYIIGIAFFTIGKEDFETKKVEQVPDKTSSNEKVGGSKEAVLEKNSNKLVHIESFSTLYSKPCQSYFF